MRKIYIENVSEAMRELPEFLDGLVDLSKPVEVYKNLNRDCFSVRQGRIVRFHTKIICLKDVTYKVSEAGRQRVLKEKRKNVHAFVVGTICHSEEVWKEKLPFPAAWVSYNPYKNDSFYVVGDGEKVRKSQYADLYNNEPILVH
tara:strand:+ start:101 stop:532 length:432 start_codon:yes stop_codon:yes gene_type:complete